MASPGRLRMIRLRTVVSALLPIVLCLLLLATIYFTLFDWEWLAFLSGVFVAAVLALTSRASSAEWRIARRTAQVRKLKETLQRQTGRSRHTEHLLEDSVAQTQLLLDALPQAILYADRQQICRRHNHAWGRALGRPGDSFVGLPLAEILGEGAHADLGQHIGRALSGQRPHFRQSLRLDGGAPQAYDVALIADAGAADEGAGFHVVLNPVAQPEAEAEAEAEAEPVPVRRPVAAAASEAAQGAAITDTAAADIRASTGHDHYFRSMSDDLTGWDDPRARFMEALEGDQFLLLYQAIEPTEADDSGPQYCEILIRLQEEERKIMPPGAFFPVAERYHLMPALDRWVVRNLLRWYWTAHHAAHPPRFCINLAADTMADAAFPDFLVDEIEASRVPASVLCFEIAETDVIANQAAAIRFSKAAASMGSAIVIDGFGGTRTSFVHLHDMAVDFLKIDGSIIGSLTGDEVSRAKVRAIIRAAHLTNRKTIAEFVERAETLALVRDLGVDYVQGFGIARPRPLSEFAPAARGN